MKLRLLAALFCFFALASAALAQGGVRYDNIVLSPGGVGIGGATVTVCTSTATGTPCSPTVSIFSNQALTVALSNPISTDQFGNYGFWIAPGTYTVTVTGGAIQSYSMTITPGCIPGATGCASGGGAFTGTLGTSFQDISEIAAPANPSSGNERLYANSTTHQLTCITSSGASCGSSVSLPTTLSAPGVFTNAAPNYEWNIQTGSGTGCTINNVLNLGGTSVNLTDGSNTLTCIPATGVTNGFTNGFASYVLNPNPNTTGVFGWVGGVGYYSQVWCTGGGAAHCWGANFSVSDATGNPAVLFGNEYDVTVNSNSSTGAGNVFSFRGNGQPTVSSDNFPMLRVVVPQGTGNFTSALKIDNGGLASAAPAFDIGASGTSGSVASYPIFLNSLASGVSKQGELISFADVAGNPFLDWQKPGASAVGDFESARFYPQGTAYSGADSAIVLTGWGTGAAVSAATGFDGALSFTVTAGSSPSANPTFAVTFKDGQWGINTAQAPIYICNMVGGTGTATLTEASSTSTVLTGKFMGTPVNASTYIFACVAMGVKG